MVWAVCSIMEEPDVPQILQSAQKKFQFQTGTFFVVLVCGATRTMWTLRIKTDVTKLSGSS